MMLTWVFITLIPTLLPAWRPNPPAPPPPAPTSRASTAPAPASAPVTASPAATSAHALRAHVETIFESAAYYRPNLDTPAPPEPGPADNNTEVSNVPRDPRSQGSPLETQDSSLSSALPPLFAIRIPPGQSRLPDHARIGRIAMDDKGRVSLDPARPAVYWAEDVVLIHNRPHRQLWYVWFLAARAPEKTAADPADAEVVARRERHRLIVTSARQSPLDAPLRNWQALRMTLSDDGFAMCTEVFQSEQIAKEYYIAEFLESAAAATFGLPAPGCAFSIEKPIPGVGHSGSPLKSQDSSPMSVARILADGPQPMGPWVYIDAADHAVTTLLCRCMPSQIKSIVENNTYDLLPLGSLAALPAADPLPAAPLSLVGLHRFDAQPDALTRDLRLPPNLP